MDIEIISFQRKEDGMRIKNLFSKIMLTLFLLVPLCLTSTYFNVNGSTLTNNEFRVYIHNIYVNDEFKGTTSTHYQIMISIRFTKFSNYLKSSTNYYWNGHGYDFTGESKGWLIGSAISPNIITSVQNGRSQMQVCFTISKGWFPETETVCHSWYSFTYNSQYFNITSTNYWFNSLGGGISPEITFRQ